MVLKRRKCARTLTFYDPRLERNKPYNPLLRESQRTNRYGIKRKGYINKAPKEVN